MAFFWPDVEEQIYAKIAAEFIASLPVDERISGGILKRLQAHVIAYLVERNLPLGKTRITHIIQNVRNYYRHIYQMTNLEAPFWDRSGPHKDLSRVKQRQKSQLHRMEGEAVLIRNESIKLQHLRLSNERLLIGQFNTLQSVIENIIIVLNDQEEREEHGSNVIEFS